MSRDAKRSEAPPILAIVREVGILTQKLTSEIERELPPEMKLTQFGVLNHLNHNDGDWSHSRLASAFQVSKGAMTNNITRLQKLGFVQIEPDQRDSRIKHVVLTDVGRETIAALNVRIEKAIAKVFGDVTSSEAKALLKQLQSFRQKLTI